MTNSETPVFGVGDASFRAAGGLPGIERLVDDFYRIMDSSDEAASVRQMYPQDLTLAREKLTVFLCGWLGGPKRYSEKFGPINIPSFHTRWHIAQAEKDEWLACMEKAIARQGYSPEFVAYLLAQLHVPAERIRQASQNLRAREDS